MSEPQDARPERSMLVRETVTIVALSLVVLVAGSLAFWATSSDQVGASTLVPVIVATLGWRSVLWIVAVVAIALRVPNRVRRRRWGIAAAAAASVVVDVIAFGPAFATVQGALAVWALQWAVGAGCFAASVAIGWMLTARLLPEPGQKPLVPLWRLLPGPLLVVGFLATLALFRQSVGVYGIIWGSSPVIADFDPEGIRYLVTAGIAVGATVAGVVLALLRRSIWLSVLGFILVPVVLFTAFVFPVPQDRWTRDPPRPENTRPACYGGEPVDDPDRPGG